MVPSVQIAYYVIGAASSDWYLDLGSCCVEQSPRRARCYISYACCSCPVHITV